MRRAAARRRIADAHQRGDAPGAKIVAGYARRRRTPSRSPASIGCHLHQRRPNAAPDVHHRWKPFARAATPKASQRRSHRETISQASSAASRRPRSSCSRRRRCAGSARRAASRCSVQDRAGRRPAAAAWRVARSVTRIAGRRAAGRLNGVFTTFGANTPQLYLDIDRTKARMLNVPLDRRLRHAAGQSRRRLRQRLQRLRAHLSGAGAGRRAVPRRSREHPAAKVRNATGELVPLGIARRHQGDGRPATCAALQHVHAVRSRADPQAGVAPARPRHHGGDWPSAAAGRHRLRVDRARLPGAGGGQHGDLHFRAVRCCSSSWCWRRQYESWTLPLAIILSCRCAVLSRA